jgi:hypothetical protein
MLKRLKSVRGMTDAEKSAQALRLAATPEERWDINQSMIKQLSPSARHKLHQEVLESARNHERRQNIG